MADNELNLTGKSFDSLKSTVKDLTKEAKDALDAIKSIFEYKAGPEENFGGYTYMAYEAQNSFAALFNLIKELNGKLAISNTRMSNLFRDQAKNLDNLAASVEKVNAAFGSGMMGGKGGKGGFAGGGGGGGKGGIGGFAGDGGGGGKGGIGGGLGDMESPKPTDIWLHGSKLKKNAMIKTGGFNFETQTDDTDINGYLPSLSLEKQALTASKKIAKANQDLENFVRKATLRYQNALDESTAKDNENYRNLTTYYAKLEAKQAADDLKETQAWYDRLRQSREEEYLQRQKEIAAKKQRAENAKKAAAREAKSDKSRINSIADLYNKTVGNITQGAWLRTKAQLAARTTFGAGPGSAAKSIFGGGSGPTTTNFLSKFATPGQTGGFGRFRVFQKPFPGSERNIFALGDLASAFNNIIYGAGSSLENAFTGITQSGLSVSRAFSGVAVSLASIVSPTVGAIIGSVSDLFLGTLSKLSDVVGGVIGAFTRLSTSLMGFATRTVEAAANFTEAVNAAKVVAGPGAAAGMERYARMIQREYGLSATDSMRGMGRIAGMLVQQGGYTQEEAGTISQEVASQLADIASVNNRSLEDVMRDFMSAVSGRFTPLRKNMLSFQAPVLDMQAKAAGMNNPALRTDLTARLRMFIADFARQAELFTGDLERTRYEFANQRRKLLGGFEALFLSVGKILEPFGKVLLITANDLMDKVLAIFDPMSQNPYERFNKAISAFAYYTVYAKQVIVEFAKRIYESRDIILDWTLYLAKAFGTLASSLLTYSVSTLQMFAGLVSQLGGLLPTIEVFGDAMMAVTRKMQWVVGSRTQDAAREARDKADTRMGQLLNQIYSMEKLGVGPNDTRMLNARSAYNEYLSDRTKLREFLQTGSDTNPPKELLKKYGVDSGTSTFMEKFSDAFTQSANTLEALQKVGKDAIEGLKIAKDKVQKETADVLAKAQPVESKPGTVKPPPPLTQAGNLVRYFDPASFRDNIQERDVANAQMQTAENTAQIVQLLQGGAMAMGGQVAMGMARMPHSGAVTGAVIGHMGVITGP